MTLTTMAAQERTRYDTLRDLEREVGVMVRRVKRVIGVRARAVHEDLQPTSYLMLGWLIESGPVRASAMVEAFNVDKGAISRQVQHLTELGLVDRTPDPDDRRASLVTASEEARRRLRAIDDERRGQLSDMLSDWPDAELGEFVSLLGRYNASLEVPAQP